MPVKLHDFSTYLLTETLNFIDIRQAFKTKGSNPWIYESVSLLCQEAESALRVLG